MDREDVRRVRWWFNTHRLVTDTAALSIAHYSALALGLFTTALVTRDLGPERYGVASIVIAYPSAIWAFSSMKPILVMTRFIAQFRASGDYDRLARVCQLGYLVDVGLSAVAVAIVAVTAPWVTGGVYGFPEMAWPMIGFASLLPITALSGTSQAVLTAFQQFRTLAAVRFMRALIFLGLTALVLAWRGGVAGYVLATAASQALASLVETIMAVRVIRHGKKGSFGKLSWGQLRDIVPLWQQLRRSLTWSYAASTVSSVSEQVLVLLLGRLASPAASGYYRLATSLTLGASVPKDAMAKVVYPDLATNWGTVSRAQWHSRLLRWTVRAGAPASTSVLVLVAALPVLIPFFFGNEYTAMVRGTQVLFVAAAFQALCFWIDPVYLATGEVGLWARIRVFEAAAIVTLGTAAIALYDFPGAATSVAVARTSALFIAVAILWRSGGIRFASRLAA